MNLRPSGYEPDELPGCSTPRQYVFLFGESGDFIRFGGDLLSHDLSRSTIGAVALNGRVRKGTGCIAHAMTTKPNKIPTTRFCSVGSKSTCCVVFATVLSKASIFTLVFVLLIIGPVSAARIERWFCCYWIKSSLSGH